jgi:hypothetical protein
MITMSTNRSDARLVYTGSNESLANFYVKLAALYRTASQVRDLLEAARQMKSQLQEDKLQERMRAVAYMQDNTCRNIFLDQEEQRREFFRARLLTGDFSLGGWLTTEKNVVLGLAQGLRTQVDPFHDPKKAEGPFNSPTEDSSVDLCEALGRACAVFADLNIESLPDQIKKVITEVGEFDHVARAAFEASYQHLRINPDSHDAPAFESLIPLDLQFVSEGIFDKILLEMHRELDEVIPKLVAWDAVAARLEEIVCPFDRVWPRQQTRLNTSVMDQADYGDLYRSHRDSQKWFEQVGRPQLAQLCSVYDDYVRNGSLKAAPTNTMIAQSNVFGLAYLWHRGNNLCGRMATGKAQATVLRDMVATFDRKLGKIQGEAVKS